MGVSASRHRIVPDSLLAVQIGVKVPLEARAGIVEAQFLVQPIDLLDVLRVELEVALQVRLDSTLGLTLGED